MTDPPEEPIARDAFDRLADGYDRTGATKPANAYLERPAILELLPSVANSRVLDAGCGAGHLTAELEDRGADATGFDVSAEMLAYARDRAPTAAFVRADLGWSFPFVNDAFDGIASSLAFHYVRDWIPLFRDLRRVLAPGGWVVFSVQHPHADFEEYDGAQNYHEIERVSATWTSFGDSVDVPAYRRPLEAVIEPIREAGIVLDRLAEPTPTDAYREADPERYAYESTHPNFLCLRLLAPE